MNGKCNRAAVSALTVFAALSTAFAATWPGFECGMGIVARVRYAEQNSAELAE